MFGRFIVNYENLFSKDNHLELKLIIKHIIFKTILFMWDKWNPVKSLVAERCVTNIFLENTYKIYLSKQFYIVVVFK